MDKLDKLIISKIKEQWPASPFPSAPEDSSLYSGIYAPSKPIKDRRDIDEEEEEDKRE